MAAAEKDREEIFYEALDIPDPVERAAYLDEACGADPDLRAGVEALLGAHERAGDFLKTPAVAGETVEGSAPLEGPGTVIGHYELLELTGEGGMGLVYLAEQKEPVRRRVAFKIIKPGMDSKQVIARFAAERQALAVLDHPNIAHVFDAGTTDKGRPYFVMEYVRGMSITRYCDEHKLTIEQRLRLFEQVCEAVQHAHQKGIIHRDLKPSNILVSVHGDRAVPKIIDFGIAKAITQPLTDKTFATLEGHLLGTPAYMSPEQVDPATQDIDTRSDIYSLGVVLYELLAGVLPFESEAFERAGLAEIQQTIREMEPVLPSLRLTGLGEQAQAIAARRGTQVIPLARRLHRELEWIPLKAMRKDRCRRYKSASDMAGDVRNYLNGNPLLAGPETTIYRVQKFFRKHAGSVTTVALVAAAIVLGLVVSIWQATVATKARNEALRANAEKDRQAQVALEERDKALVAQQQAEEQRQRAGASEEQAQNLLYAANMNLAQQAWEQNHVARLRQLLAETAAYPGRGFEWYYWQRQVHRGELRTFPQHNSVIHCVAFCSDGRTIVTGSADGRANVWEVDSGKELLSFYHPLAVLSVAFAPDGRRVATGSDLGTVRVWEVDSGRELLTLQAHTSVCSVAFSPDGQQIVTGGSDMTARVWEAASGKELLTLQGHKGIVWSSVFSRDGQQIATSSDDTTAKIWDANSGEELRTLQGHSLPVWSVAFSPDGERIVTGSWDGTARIWEISSGKELLILRDPRGSASVAVSPDGRWIVTGNTDGAAKVWEAASGKELVTLKGHGGAILSVAFSPDGQQILTGSADQTAKLWEATLGEESTGPKKQALGIRSSMAFSLDGQRMITGGFDGTATVWDAKGDKESFTVRGHSAQIWAVAFSPDDRRIVTCALDGTAKIWDAARGNEVLSLKGHSAPIFAVAYSPEAKRIVTGSHDATAKIWDADSGSELLTLKWHDGPVQSVAFSSDGKRIATGSWDSAVKIWDADSGKELLSLKEHGGRIHAIAFSPDGQRIVTGGRDMAARVWETSTGKELLTLQGHNGGIRSAAFSPDAQRVCTGGFSDGTAKIWEVASGKELLTLKGDSIQILAVTFSPDGQHIATGTANGKVQVWDAASAEQAEVWLQEEKADTARRLALLREEATAVEHDRTLRAQDPGAVKQWLVLAPLAFDGQDNAAALAALDQQQLPREATLRPRGGERVSVGDTEQAWRAVQQEDNLIDFNRLLGEPTHYCLAYAVCYIDSEGERAGLVMKVGSGDPLKVYLNGGEVYRRAESIQNYAWSGTDVAKIKLEAGLNVLVLKVVNLVADWRVSIRLTDAAGQPVKGIRVTLEPPKEVQP